MNDYEFMLECLKPFLSAKTPSESKFIQRINCQVPLRGGGDFSVSADNKKNTTGRLDKEPRVKSKAGTKRPKV